MRVISRKSLEAFWRKHPDAEVPLKHWFKTAKTARWKSIQDVRRIFASADPVETKHGDELTVFNVGGNKYRLIARIKYEYALINVRFVLTHAEYNKEKWKEV